MSARVRVGGLGFLAKGLGYGAQDVFLTLGNSVLAEQKTILSVIQGTADGECKNVSVMVKYKRARGR